MTIRWSRTLCLLVPLIGGCAPAITQRYYPSARDNSSTNAPRMKSAKDCRSGGLIAAKRQENNVKRFIINVVMVAVGLGVSLASRTSEAAEHDLRVGSFEGNWCGYEARFDILERVENKWEFRGKILIKKTKEYDKIYRLKGKLRQLPDRGAAALKRISTTEDPDVQIMGGICALSAR